MNDIKKETGHLNVADAALNRVKNIIVKKKRHYRKRKKIENIF